MTIYDYRNQNTKEDEYEVKDRKLKNKANQKNLHKHKNKRAGFEQLLNDCMTIYDYQEEFKDLSQKKNKIKNLSKILESIAESDRKFVDTVFRPCIDKVMEMIEANLFRPLPKLKQADLDAMEGGEQNEENKDRAWPTLIYVYEIFLHTIKHPAINENILKHFITESYIQNLLDLFETSNNDERDYLKQVVHKLYAKVIKRRKLFRKMFNNHFLSIVYEKPNSVGASEILDIYSSIISGFAVPLRPEHVDFFKTFLTPLLKVQTCHTFYEELLRCLLRFLNKEKSFTKHLVMALLDFWPYGNTTKEVGFIVSLYESLDFISDIEEFETYMVPLFKRIAKCLDSEHVQIIDRSMTFFEKENLLQLVKTNSESIYPLIVPVIERQLKEHWHNVLKKNFKDLKLILVELDELTYNSASKEYLVQQEAKITKRKTLDDKWKLLDAKIKDNSPDYTSP